MPAQQKYEPDNMGVHLETGYCPYPVGCDTYRSCVHNCLYCYERFAHNQHLRRAKSPVPRDYAAAFRGIHDDPWVRYYVLEKRLPVNIGLLSDPFPPREARDKITHRFLSLLYKAGITWRLQTKAPDRIPVDVLEMMAENGSLLVVSFSSLDDGPASVLEPGAPSPSSRLEAMRKAKSMGVVVQLKLAPYIFGMEYDYSVFADACDGVAIEFLRYSALWRNQMDIRFWRTVLQDESITSPREAEIRYFSYVRTDDMPWWDEDNNWVVISPYKVRQILLGERAKADQYNLKLGFCVADQAIHSIDLTSSPVCCPGNLPYDDLALVPQWHYDQWAGYRPPLWNRLDSNVLMPRLVMANAPMCRPWVWDVRDGEDRFGVLSL